VVANQAVNILGTGFLEFQIPPVIAKYASFMFSFIGRGVCTCSITYPHPSYTLEYNALYLYSSGRPHRCKVVTF